MLSPRARAFVEVRLDALKRNLVRVRAWVGPSVRVLAVVKADGYGLGAERVGAAALEAGADRLGVCTAEEGVQLREAGIAAPIQLLGALAEEELCCVVPYRLTPSVQSVDDVRRVSEHARRAGRRVPVHLHVDTGMGRHGASCAEAARVARAIADDGALRLAGLATHIQSTEDPDRTAVQLQRFDAVRAALPTPPPLVHAAASAALARYPGARFSMVRPGIALYGSLGAGPGPLELAVRLRARVLSVRTVEPGEGVSYGARFVAARPTRVATVAIGYRDGVPLALSCRGEVLLHGRRCPILGRVTMDALLVDATDVGAEAGDLVTLIGRDGAEELTLEEVSARAGTIPYALLTGLGPRVKRVYLDAPGSRRTDRARWARREHAPSAGRSAGIAPATRAKAARGGRARDTGATPA